MPEFTANHDPVRSQRREEMLGILLAKVRSRRRLRRAGAGAGLLASLAIIALLARVPAEPSGPRLAAAPVAPAVAEPVGVPHAAPVIRTVRVETDAGVLERTSVSRAAVRTEFVDDATLVASLEPTCGPVGLGRIGNDVRVLGGCPEIYASAAKR